MPSITFAVVGHNEARSLPTAFDQLEAAASPSDRLLFVDSASTDESRVLAERRSIPVLPAPIGKGRAVATALRHCTTDYLCLLDGDLHGSERNIADALGGAVREWEADMVIGDFQLQEWLVPGATEGIWRPLAETLFPEGRGRFGGKPLSGFRALRRDAPFSALPPGFGLEAHLNVQALMRGLTVRTTHLGGYAGGFRYKPEMGFEIAAAILDLAEEAGRLERARRPAWDAWVAGMVDTFRGWRGEPHRAASFAATLRAAVRRPLPAAG